MTYRVVIVDDEPDVHALTRLSLKNMRLNNQPLELVFHDSGAEAVADLAAHPETALILMDVVMESDSAGLEAIRTIRETQENEIVRILLRTGQPGSAPEKQVIETYDIDGYLSKADLTQSRLFSSVRTALKAYTELRLLQEHRDHLAYLNLALLSLYSTDNIPACLEELTQMVSALAGSELTLVYFCDMSKAEAIPHIYFHGPENMDDDTLHQQASEIMDQIQADPERLLKEADHFAAGWLSPLQVPNTKSYGMIYVHIQQPSDLQQVILEMLTSHACNALSRLPAH